MQIAKGKDTDIRHSSFTKVLSNLQESPRELTNQVDAVKFYGEHCI